MQAAGQDASARIGAAGSTVAEAFSRTASDIAEATKEVGAKAARDLLAPLDSIAARLRETADGVTAAAGGTGRLGDGVRASAEAAERAAGQFRGASEALVAAAIPLRATTERIETGIRQLAEATQHVAGTVSQSAEQTARSAADALAAAQTALGGQARAIEASLAGAGQLVDRLKGQGAQLDSLDEKLGTAFDLYAVKVAAAVDTLSDYVRRMQAEVGARPRYAARRRRAGRAVRPREPEALMRGAIRRHAHDEEEESAFVSMTDLTVSFLFIVIILLAFFASQLKDDQTVPVAEYQRVFDERNALRTAKEALERERDRLAAENAELRREVARLEEELRKERTNRLQTYLAAVSNERDRILRTLRDRLLADFPNLKEIVSIETGALRFKGEGCSSPANRNSPRRSAGSSLRSRPG